MFDFDNDDRAETGYEIFLDQEELGISREQIVEQTVWALAEVLKSSFYSDERRRALIEINEFLETL